MNKLTELFYDLSGSIGKENRLNNELKSEQEKIQSLKSEILNNKDLNHSLSTVGIVHDGKIYKKIRTPFNNARHFDDEQYYLEISDYVEPVNSFALNEIGDSNE